MKKQTRIVLMPEYLQQFKCIGGDCPDTCCIGWNVNIDKKTYKKYQGVTDKKIRNLLHKNIKRHHEDADENKYARITLLDGGVCPMLDENMLCKVHSTLGADYLSDTCTVYPRVINIVNEQVEKTAAMSCPEIARLALLSKKPMQRIHIEESIRERMNERTKLQTSEEFIIIQNSAVWVLQNRNYTISERIFILGIIAETIQQQVTLGKGIDVISIINHYQQLLSTNKKIMVELDGFGEKNEQIQIQLQILQKLSNERIDRGIKNLRYYESFIQFLEGIKYEEGKSMEEIAYAYEEAYTKYYEPFFKDREHIFENYLVNYIFRTVYPAGAEGIFNSYILLVLHFSLIKMHLVGLAGYYKEEFNEEFVLKLIQSFAKTVEHNQSYVEDIVTMIHEDKKADMSFMTLLIMN